MFGLAFRKGRAFLLFVELLRDLPSLQVFFALELQIYPTSTLGTQENASIHARILIISASSGYFVA